MTTALTRRGIIAAASTAPLGRVLAAQPGDDRPAPADRRFTSPAVEAERSAIAARIANPKIRRLWNNCFPNTLDTTVALGGSDQVPDTVVITGDIPCLWLRDSACQVRPYLHLAARDAALTRLFRGLIGRHARSILIDPYANAFMADPSAPTSLDWARGDVTEMKPGVAERKWEVDSLLHPMRLAHDYWRATGDAAPFNTEWRAAMALAVETLVAQQRLTGAGPYRFQRRALSAIDTLAGDGYGAPTRKVGLIHSMFRPSDDACVLPFLIPSNIFAVRALSDLATLAELAAGDTALAAAARQLAGQLRTALAAHGTMRLADGAIVYAYEVDGFGNALFMDDANIPSLSSLAYLGACSRNDPLFRRTAARAWSRANPYFYSGRAGAGIGGPHVGAGQIWPMSLMVRALSTDDPATVALCLKTLAATDAGTGFMHEAFDEDDPARFTRPWFAWANSLFAEMILQLLGRHRF